LSNSINGELIYRNIVTFVKYVDFEYDMAQFTEKMLEKIPIQIGQYARMKGI